LDLINSVKPSEDLQEFPTGGFDIASKTNTFGEG
jgi:hypothetical protein